MRKGKVEAIPMDCKAIFISANDSSTLVPVIRSMLDGLMSDRGEVSNPCCTIYMAEQNAAL